MKDKNPIIEFAEWCRMNYYPQLSGWAKEDYVGVDNVYYTTEELYKIWIKGQDKKKRGDKIPKKIREDKELLEFTAAVLQKINPHTSCCEKCGIPFHWCVPRTVNYSERRGTFATCEVCWGDSTLEELHSMFTVVYNRQKESATERGELVMGHSLSHLLDCVTVDYIKEKDELETTTKRD
jgi:hypothetical protein